MTRRSKKSRITCKLAPSLSSNAHGIFRAASQNTYKPSSLGTTLLYLNLLLALRKESCKKHFLQLLSLSDILLIRDLASKRQRAVRSAFAKHTKQRAKLTLEIRLPKSNALPKKLTDPEASLPGICLAAHFLPNISQLCFKSNFT